MAGAGDFASVVVLTTVINWLQIHEEGGAFVFQDL